MTINAKVQQKFEIQHSFPLEALQDQVKDSISKQFGSELASRVKFTTELVDNNIVITATLDELSTSTATKQRRTRKTQKTDTDSVTESTDSDSVDLSDNKVIAPTEAKNVLEAAGLEVDSDSLPETKELTKEQYKTLKDSLAKEQTTDYDKLASVLAFESQHPDLVVEALYKDTGNIPKPIAHPTATSLSDKLSKEEQEYVTYFNWCERAKGHKVVMPVVNTPTINGVQVAPRRYIEIQDKEGNILKKYVKYPFVAELKELETPSSTTQSNKQAWE